MYRDYTAVLWLLKLGCVINLYFLVQTHPLASGDADVYIVQPRKFSLPYPPIVAFFRFGTSTT